MNLIAAGASEEAPIVDFDLQRLSIVAPAQSRECEASSIGALSGVGSVTTSVYDSIGHRGSAMISGTLVSHLTDLSEVLRCKHTPSRVEASQDCMCVSGESETLSRFCSFSDCLKSACLANDINSASVFEVHGNNHPLVGRYRTQLSSLLY